MLLDKIEKSRYKRIRMLGCSGNVGNLTIVLGEAKWLSVFPPRRTHLLANFFAHFFPIKKREMVFLKYMY